jgi:chromate reductase
VTDRITRVLAIPGSLRRESYNRLLAKAAVTLTPPSMSLTVYDSLETVPVFNEDLEHPPPAGVIQLRDAVAAADGLFIATPEYNQSVPGVVKNMVDWLSRCEGPEGLAEKPVAVTGVTTGPWGTRLAQTLLRQMLTSTQSLVLPQPTLFMRDAETLFNSDRRLADHETQRRLREFLESFDHWIRRAPA